MTHDKDSYLATWHEEKITCPYCGYKNEDSFEYQDIAKDIECGDCGKLFDLVEIEFHAEYTTKRKENDCSHESLSTMQLVRGDGTPYILTTCDHCGLYKREDSK